MVQGRDSKGRFIKGNVPLNKRADSILPTIAGRMLIGGGVSKTERVRITCPACGLQVEAVAMDGRVKGYCGVARRHVDFLIETQPVPIGKHLTVETKAKLSAALKRRYNNERKPRQ